MICSKIFSEFYRFFTKIFNTFWVNLRVLDDDFFIFLQKIFHFSIWSDNFLAIKKNQFSRCNNHFWNHFFIFSRLFKCIAIFFLLKLQSKTVFIWRALEGVERKSINAFQEKILIVFMTLHRTRARKLKNFSPPIIFPTITCIFFAEEQ